MDSETGFNGELWSQWLMWGFNSFVLLGLFVFIINWYLRRKEFKDAWNECDDPNVPDLRKYWCRKCRGHHGREHVHEGASRCRNCDSTLVYRVSPITLWEKFSYSLLTLMFFTLGTVVLAAVGWRGQPTTYLCYGLAVIFAVPFAYVYRFKSAVRNEWLIWAKERGYEENAEKD
jgi:magnesium-transporting ATPase (P-type)